MPSCPICRHSFKPGLESWHRICTHCGYEAADLAPAINDQSAHRTIDEESREAGLRSLRTANFRRLLAEMSRYASEGAELLEVGCAHGWFLDEARARFKVTGIEPDRAIYSVSARSRPYIRNGYSPDALDADEKFDIIVFNDVLEHIPDVTATLASCHRHLNHGGLLVINIPSSRGIFYRASKLLARAGIKKPFFRMWQESLPSPHLHYFSPSNLSKLLRASSFRPVGQGTLPSVELAGLRSRIDYTPGSGAVFGTIVYLGVAATLPLIRFSPSDIMYVLATRSDQSDAR